MDPISWNDCQTSCTLTFSRPRKSIGIQVKSNPNDDVQMFNCEVL